MRYGIILLGLILGSGQSLSAQVVGERETWTGRIGVAVAGAPLAIDTGADGRVDTIVDPATATVTLSQVPSGSTLEHARLYWGGTQTQTGAACTSVADSTVPFAAPSTSSAGVLAEECSCSDGGSTSYDVHVCTADITTLVTSGIQGDYVVGGYAGRVNDGTTDNASFAVVLVYRNSAVSLSRVILSDGIQQFQNSVDTLTISGLSHSADTVATLAYYSLEGDIAGTGSEFVKVIGRPGGSTITLSDAINPVDNPMNRTINVVSPPQTDVVGMDLDEFPIGSALTKGDDEIDVVLSAGSDKWWLAFVVASVALSDKKLTERDSWTGRIGVAFAGAALAEDTGVDGKVDAIVDPATGTVTSAQVPDGSTLESARLYWGGTQTEVDASCSSVPDSVVTLAAPGVSAAPVTAEECICSDGGSASYDVHVCTADVTAHLDPNTLQGNYAVSGYAGQIANGSVDNASFSIVLVYRNGSIGFKRVVLVDGLEQFQNRVDTVTTSDFEIGASASGSLTYYTLEGDVVGTGSEFVRVAGLPGGLSSTLSDASSPADNPMNRTINVVSPAQTDVVGMDLDTFPIGSSLTAGDTDVAVTLSAGTDKWWLSYLVVSVDVKVMRLLAAVLLEGAYSGQDSMDTSATFRSALPTSQPYSDPVFDGTVREYDSAAFMTANPDTVVDWILVSLRTDPAAATEITGSVQPALLYKDGAIRGVDGDTLAFPEIQVDSAYVVVRHRNHAGVMSNGRVDFSGGDGVWDFTTAMTKAYSTGGDPMEDLGNGDFGMFSSDGSIDNQVTVADFNIWLADTKAVLSGYLQTDFNLDGIVTAADFNQWLQNTKAVASSMVP